jgi:hypothetical protein
MGYYQVGIKDFGPKARAKQGLWGSRAAGGEAPEGGLNRRLDWWS